MAVELAPMPESGFEGWLPLALEHYVESRERAGDTHEQARARAERSMATYFPDGHLLEGHFVFEVMADGEPVGAVWIGPNPQVPDGRSWWVYDIGIAEEHRRKGYGRAAMLLAEEEVRKLGGTSLGLNVFGFNTDARSLYESLGFETVSLQLRKRLGEPPAGS